MCLPELLQHLHFTSWNPLSFSDEDFMPLTWTQNPQGRSVIFLHPLLSIIQQQAYRCRSSIKLINFQPLHHFPVTTCKITNWLFTLPALTYCCKLSAGRLTAKAGTVTTVSKKQKQWQLFFFLPCIHKCSRVLYPKQWSLPLLSRQVTLDRSLNLFCHI